MPEDVTILILGVGIGGSKILKVVTHSQGRMLSRDRSIPSAQKDHEAIIRFILESAYPVRI